MLVSGTTGERDLAIKMNKGENEGMHENNTIPRILEEESFSSL